MLRVSDLSFGRYEPLFRIAAGGMAEVYAARIRGEAGFEKLVAVKRMLPHLTDDPEFVAMFLDEGRLAANIASPNVVATLDLGRGEDGSLYIVMDLVVGIALSTIVRTAARQGRMLPVPIACEILAQAASGLDDAHEARTPTGVHLGIVHRDVSPQNVLVGVDGRTRVVDFGVARAVLRQSHTSTGTLKGKFGYFSPEQAAAKELDPRSDVFALGIVAWETLLGRRLFEADNPLETITRIRSMPIVRPSELRPEISDAISDVVMRALARDRDMRWESAGAFAAALRKAVGVPVTSREVSAVVMEIGATPVQEMQSRIEAAMAGDHLVTKRKDIRAMSRSDDQATPSGVPGHVGDLPTLVKIAVPPELAPPSVITSSAEPSRPSSRWWIAGIAVSALLVLVIGVALATRAPEPVSTQLSSPPPTTVSVTVVPVALPPPETQVSAAPPQTGIALPVHAPHPTRVSAPPPSSVAPETPPPPPSTAAHAPPSSGATHPPPTSVVHESPPPPPPTLPHPPETSTTRHPAGLAGDEAFDHGI